MVIIMVIIVKGGSAPLRIIDIVKFDFLDINSYF